MKTTVAGIFSKGNVALPFLLISAVLLYFFPHSASVKALLLLASLLIGLLPISFDKKPGQAISDRENVFFLKNREIGPSRIVAVVAPLLYYVLLRQYSVSFVMLMAAVMLAITLLVEFFYESEYPRQYLYLENDTLKREASGAVHINLKALKYVKINPNGLVMYEKWAHHKIVFDKFEEGERLKETLLAKIKTLNIELK